MFLSGLLVGSLIAKGISLTEYLVFSSGHGYDKGYDQLFFGYWWSFWIWIFGSFLRILGYRFLIQRCNAGRGIGNFFDQRAVSPDE